MKKSDILSALTIVKPGLSNKEVIEQASSFAFIDGRIVTYNDEISISHPIEGLEIEGAIRADLLYGLLSKIKTDEVELQVVGNELIVKSGRAKAGITLQEEIKLPLDEIAQKSKWKSLPENFAKYLSLAAGTCSTDMSNAKMTCVNVTSDGLLQASDNYKIIQIDLKGKMHMKDFLLPATSANLVSKMLPKKISEGEGWIHFKTEFNSIISCRVYDDKYPNVSPILDMEGGMELVLPETLSTVLDRAGIFSKEDKQIHETIEISILPKKLLIKATSENGWFEESIKTDYAGDPISFKVAPYLLKDILSETRNCIIGTHKLKFETEDWIYVSALKAE